MRTKSFSTIYILEKAHNLAVKEGVSGITIRNLAHELGCSTQPIYLAFENIATLREELIQRIVSRMQREFFPENVTLSNYIQNLGRLIASNPELYSSLNTDRLTHRRMQQFLYRQYSESIKNIDLTIEQKKLIYGHILGIFTSSFCSEERLERDKVIQIVQEQIEKTYFSAAEITVEIDRHTNKGE